MESACEPTTSLPSPMRLPSLRDTWGEHEHDMYTHNRRYTPVDRRVAEAQSNKRVRSMIEAMLTFGRVLPNANANNSAAELPVPDFQRCVTPRPDRPERCLWTRLVCVRLESTLIWDPPYCAATEVSLIILATAVACPQVLLLDMLAQESWQSMMLPVPAVASARGVVPRRTPSRISSPPRLEPGTSW